MRKKKPVRQRQGDYITIPKQNVPIFIKQYLNRYENSVVRLNIVDNQSVVVIYKSYAGFRRAQRLTNT
jgi:hypothetical protein